MRGDIDGLLSAACMVVGRSLQAYRATRVNRWPTSWQQLLSFAHWEGSGHLLSLHWRSLESGWRVNRLRRVVRRSGSGKGGHPAISGQSAERSPMQPGAGEYQGLGQLTTGCRGAGCSANDDRI